MIDRTFFSPVLTPFSPYARYLYPEPHAVSYHGASPRTPLLAVSTLALFFDVNSVWFSARRSYLFPFLIFFRSHLFCIPPPNTYPPSPSPRTYSLHCSKHLTTLLRITYDLITVSIRIRVGSQDTHLDRILMPPICLHA